MKANYNFRCTWKGERSNLTHLGATDFHAKSTEELSRLASTRNENFKRGDLVFRKQLLMIVACIVQSLRSREFPSAKVLWSDLASARLLGIFVLSIGTGLWYRNTVANWFGQLSSSAEPSGGYRYWAEYRYCIGLKFGRKSSFVETQVCFGAFLLKAYWLELTSVEHSYRLDLKLLSFDLDFEQVLLNLT
uniref:Uncharacterized protein n=1 Tax=Ananas comosus var. bracteatus TaxID=296719 RepID=A0A6V7PF08_ANACO|nr:unnamed protein product [Ananas comosus var. bracteatus]